MATKKTGEEQRMIHCKKCLKANILFVLFLASALLPGSTWGGERKSAREIMEMVDARDDGDKSIADLHMLLIDRRGKKRSRSLRSFGLDQGDDRSMLMFFKGPADVKGTGFLSYDYDEKGKDDEQWLYLPALKKTKRIATKDKSGSFMGSDFSYSDLTKHRLDDYTYSFHEKRPEVEVYGKRCWVIDSVPVSKEVIKETGYSRSTLFVRQDNVVVVRAIHYVDDGDVKYFDVKKMELIANIWTNTEIHMTRKKGRQTVHRTILTFENVLYNQESIHAPRFTTRQLEKGLW